VIARAERAQQTSILLVDDRPEDLIALKNVLARPEYRIVTAGSGAEALRHLLREDFAVVLLDIVMPVMDGFEVAALIKQRDRTRLTPILFLTAGNQDLGAIYRAYSVGAVDYLVKPLDEAIVRAKVAIFAQLFDKDQFIKRQAEELGHAYRRERELKAAELRLLSERRYRALVETIPASVWTADAHGVVNYCNRQWHSFTGMRFEQSRGGGWLQAVHPGDAERVAAAWQSAQTERQPLMMDLRLRRADGLYRWQQCHAVPEKQRGRVRGWLAMFADCEDLKQAVSARDEFLSVASHELRTPLTTLLLRLESLTREVTAEGNQRLAEKLLAARKQGMRLARLVESLLDVSRIAAGQLQLEREPIDFVDVVRQVAERFAEEASRAGIQVNVQAASDLIPGNWDRLRLEQVVTNLLSNALKYGEGKPVDLVIEATPEAARLHVHDHGMGIDERDHMRIFDRFERAVSSGHHSGLGIGLYVSRRIAHAHGGSISVVSQKGHGSTFTLEVPVEPARPM
jgi:PAS domain S-box-containing protein